jgi:hypothetical protein
MQGSDSDMLHIPSSGFNREQKLLLRQFQSSPFSADANILKNSAEALISSDNDDARGHFLLGVAECSDNDFSDAASAFRQASELPGGSRLFKRNRRYIVHRLMPHLADDEADDDLIAILASRFHAAREPMIRKAAYSQGYWLRWNTVDILKADSFKVDMVQVYILDLKYSGSSRTKIRAAKKLG